MFILFRSSHFIKIPNIFVEAGVMNISHLEPALRHCTHLIYGYAKINPDTFTIEQLNTRLDITLQNYHAVTQLKHKYPEMKVLLSVGGDADEFFQEKYVNMVTKKKIVK